MRRAHKKQAEEFVQVLAQAHDRIRKTTDINEVFELLEQCQEGAIELGNLIEKTEGTEFKTVAILENYCEMVYQIYEELRSGKEKNMNHFYKKLRKLLIQIENSIKNDIKARLEIVFLPYKASMWDSLESVWMAAQKDPDCDVYVIPIPYYERNGDGALGVYHYEGGELPLYVPVTHYNDYLLEERMPDVIYIHNPYDNKNYVTSVDPRFYSEELKRCTDCLVYIPYYCTSGGLGDGQKNCKAYYNADYIVIQAENYRDAFDSELPQEKFLPFGSPKFDKIIRVCKNPPEPPTGWQRVIRGRKTYFYNTSIGGMLGDTVSFLKKMEYVFHCFEGREDACLIWRPHPLLESTFDSMRPGLRPVFDTLKNYYMENKIGIYDDTADITDTIALCDAYIGDAGTSVTSLFGIAGKPIFIFNNQINTKPAGDDWRGEFIKMVYPNNNDRYMITQGNKLYYAPDNDYQYEYYCDLSEYASGDYYIKAIETGNKIYICPSNARDILIIEERKVKKRVLLAELYGQAGSFFTAWNTGNYLFLIPFKYPAVVRYDTVKDKVEYIEGYNELFVSFVQGEWRVGGSCVWNNYLLIASPTDNCVLSIESETCSVKVLKTGSVNKCGGVFLIPESSVDSSIENQYVWILPYSGTVITRWNPATDEVREYTDIPAEFKCINRSYGFECNNMPFWTAAFCDNEVIFSPYWGNMFLRLNKETGKIKEWEPPFPVPEKPVNGYYDQNATGAFLYRTDAPGECTYRYFSLCDCKLYDVNLKTNEYKEIIISFNLEELKEHECGFCEDSEWLQYSCGENYFHSLEMFLDGNIVGQTFDKERQIRAFESIAANHDGSCGEKVHQFVVNKL